MTELIITAKRRLSHIDPKIYGQFIEHFHRQLYGGIFDPGSSLSDEDHPYQMRWQDLYCGGSHGMSLFLYLCRRCEEVL